jgi:hypothetical protein
VAYRRGAKQHEIYVIAALALVLGMVTFNKVGSPQYYGWVAVPVIAGLILGVPRMKPAVIMSCAAALLTQLIFPFMYEALTWARPLSVVVFMCRNLVEVAFWIWAMYRLYSLVRKTPTSDTEKQSGKPLSGKVEPILNSDAVK